MKDWEEPRERAQAESEMQFTGNFNRSAFEKTVTTQSSKFCSGYESSQRPGGVEDWTQQPGSKGPFSEQ
ncbi:hypothetical protein SKAU_G00406640 [Synaphobranchus kaupii]|uniref:Uncharacterized protein n=1 Tax=Synaphobranchus kaupii TaxID=118154 RepID=A0A9Q1IC34_SYNKA|nr:hypothetical protein SKAU_G00406640 [Synaphobranchus kaupii]